MKLFELFSEDLVFLQQSFKSKSQLIESLVGEIAKQGKISNVDPVLTSLLEREEVNTSAVNDQIAVPHLRTDMVVDFVAAFCCLKNSLDFGALDKQNVNFVLLLLAPKEKAGEYLALLARFSRIFKKEENRKKVLTLNKADEFINFIKIQEG